MNNSTGITNKLLKIAFALSIITIIYNIIEGLVSTFFGFNLKNSSTLASG